MTPVLIKVVEAIAQDVLTLVHLILDENGVGDSLINEAVEVKVDQCDNPVIRVLFDDYITYIDAGRKPRSGNMPPISALRDWAQRKGIPTDNQTLFLISRAIWENGITGRPILATLESEIERSFENKWADSLMAAIIKEVDNLFK